MVNPERLFQAIAFAARAHEGEKRKGENPSPYICHPFFVGLELLRAGCDEDTVIAGILHDTLEDGFPGLPREEVVEALQKNFEARVVELIQGVTEPKDPNMTREEKERTWEERKLRYRERLSSLSPEVRAIACADMWANILEFWQTLQREGVKALEIFNVKDIGKKLEHWQQEINIFYEKDGEGKYPYLCLADRAREVLEDIRALVNRFGTGEHLEL
ncbi:HD domain-containing protein [Candidatus Caldatribacterium saccharofermentans]|uniref:HD domain-containing protein n=1 Tax=Candidatus Caldatribacterium saccharofermentans TaxID=1454753 RepID=UPI003D08B638